MHTSSLQDFVEQVTGQSHLRIEHDYGDGFVKLMTSEAERRQAVQDIQCSENIVLELLRNARDAHASHVFVASSKEGSIRTLSVIDDGDGIPETMHELVFEPRVTSKLDTSHKDAWGLHGRGMALYSISVNAKESRIVSSSPGLGSAFRVESDTRELSERSDQSSFPTFELSDKNRVNVRGPRNILRTACEFAIECRDTCSVFVGSQAEIAATLYAHGAQNLSAIDRLFCDDVNKLPLTKRLATASTPDEFVTIAESLGLTLSSRTARRIMGGEIEPKRDLLNCITVVDKAETPRGNAKPRKGMRKAIALAADDRDQFAQCVQDGFKTLASKYYLNPDVEAKVRVQGDRLIVSIPTIRQP